MGDMKSVTQEGMRKLKILFRREIYSLYNVRNSMYIRRSIENKIQNYN